MAGSPERGEKKILLTLLRETNAAAARGSRSLALLRAHQENACRLRRAEGNRIGRKRFTAGYHAAYDRQARERGPLARQRGRSSRAIGQGRCSASSCAACSYRFARALAQR